MKEKVAVWPGATESNVGEGATLKSGEAITIGTGLEVLVKLFASPL